MASSPISTRCALLQALIHEEGFGLQLIERISKLTGGAITCREGSVYPALRQLEEWGYIQSRNEDRGDRGGKHLVIYKITRAGLKVALRERALIVGLFTDTL